MSKIKVLHPRESGDTGMMQMIAQRQHIPREDVIREVELVLTDLSVQLPAVAQAYRAGRFDEVVNGARAAAVTASSLQLDRLARVARTVCALATTDDSAALAANLARMIRLGEDALENGWDMALHSI